MNGKYNWQNLGRDLTHTVRSAVKPEDMEHLKSSIDDIVSELAQVGREFSQAPRYQQPTPAPKEAFTRPANHPIVPAASDDTGRRVAGVVLTVFGGLSATVAAILGLVWLGGILSGVFPSVVATLFLLLFVVFGSLSAALLLQGSSFRKEGRRYAQYLKLFQGQKVFPLEQLSALMGKSKSYLTRDLRRMIEAGRLPHAHLDAQNTNIILDEETYKQYLLADRRSRELAKTKRKPQPAPEPTPTPAAPAQTSLLREGRAYIERIHAADLAILDEALSRKIVRLESTVSKIFDCVEEHPEKQGELRRLMNYYLPTTLKLLDAYHKFEVTDVGGENASTTMEEIEKALDTINLAFENLLNNLFEHEMYDITSDISALETMLAQEGLTTPDFATPEKNSVETIGGVQENGQEKH